MASPSAGSKRPRAEESSPLSELSAPILAFLSASDVLHVGMEGAGRSTLADAVSVLPFSAADISRFLSSLAATGGVDSPPPFTLATGNCASLLFLTPMYPVLRTLTVRDAARAWVLVDMLCLDATRRIEDDLVQRYAESPSSEDDWRGALTVAGCPACDTLWELVTKKYAALRTKWANDVPLPDCFGAVSTASQTRTRASWQLGLCFRAIRAIALMSSGAVEIVGVCLAPTILASICNHSNVEVVGAAFTVLQRLGSPELFIGGYLTALSRLASDVRHVRSVTCSLLELVRIEGAIPTHVATAAIPLLVAALTRHSGDAIVVSNTVAAMGVLSIRSLLPSVFTTIVANGCLPILYSALILHIGNVSTMVSSVGALYYIADCSTPADRAAVVAAGADSVPPLLAVLSLYPEEAAIAQAVSGLLGHLAGGKGPVVDSIPLLLAALSRHDEEEHTLRAIATALGRIFAAALDNSRAAGTGASSTLDTLRADVIPGLLAAWARRSADADSVVSCVDALATLASSSNDCCTALVEGGSCIPLARAALLATLHGADAEVVRAVSMLLARLASSNSSNSSAIIAGGCVPLMIGACHRVVDKGAHVMNMNYVLRSLLVDAGSDMKAALVAGGCLPMLLTALERDTDACDAYGVEEKAAVLELLANGSASVCDALVAGGGIPALLAAYKRDYSGELYDSRTTTATLAGALATIASSSTANRDAVVAAGVDGGVIQQGLHALSITECGGCADAEALRELARTCAPATAAEDPVPSYDCTCTMLMHNTRDRACVRTT